MVVILVATIGTSFGLNVLSSRDTTEVPQTLAEMKLTSYAEGSRAMAQINSLHNENIDLKNAFVAEYSDDFNPYSNENRQATVWVGTAGSSQAASELLSSMVAGITDGSPGFSNLQTINVSGNDVYQVDGIGSTHYFYQSLKSADKIVWLTVKAGEEQLILDKALDIF